jgi:peptidoglycan-N-acetylmuramic acid deacetylase
MSYFRFPKGEFSQQSLAIVQDLGYKSVFWSYAYEDWDPDNQADETKAFTTICESTHSGEIMLLHAVSKTNANILAKVIDDVEKQGYTFTTEIA